MTPMRAFKTTKHYLPLVLCSVCLVLTGCSSKKQPSTTVSSTTVKPLASPSITYLSNGVNSNSNTALTAEQWLTIAKTNYESKKYARSLRAATQAVSLDSDLVEARQLAMLSAVSVTQVNIDSYNDNTLLNDQDRTELRDTFSHITSLINTP